jgi:hypothetical protein
MRARIYALFIRALKNMTRAARALSQRTSSTYVRATLPQSSKPTISAGR